jgi:hypothetical protein
LIIADHVAINAVEAEGAQLVLILFIVLLVVALFMENVGAVIAHHSLVVGDGVAA